MNTCPICARMLADSSDEHHLIPKTFKGKETITLHKICHKKLHSCITEREMLHYYHTVERLLEHEEVKKFVKWVQKKEPNYDDSHRDSRQRKRKR